MKPIEVVTIPIFDAKQLENHIETAAGKAAQAGYRLKSTEVIPLAGTHGGKQFTSAVLLFFEQ